MTLATNLDEVYRACNPDLPLKADDTRYVDLSTVRGTKIISKTIARSIARSDQFHQQLFTGHRGSGKTTELFRLTAELESEHFFVVYLDTEELLDLSNLNYLDVLLSIAKEIESGLRIRGISLNSDLLSDLTTWFSERIIEGNDTREFIGSVKTQADAGIEIPFFAKLLSSLTAEIKSGSSRRISTRQKLEQELAVFIVKLNALISNARNQVQQRGFKDLVLMVDGLEKMPYVLMPDGYSNHTHLFVLHADQIKAPQCHIIYTIPISLAYNANLGNDFNSVLVLPMVKINDAGIVCLRQVIENRVDLAQTFEQSAQLDELIKLSGGVVRDLMRLVQLSTDTDNPKISEQEIQYACTTLTREYDRLLRDDELEFLKRVNDTRRVTGEEVYARMLSLRLILEYQNGERWAALHPAALAVPWLKRALQAEAT
jgi:hypothetical protein